MIRPACSDDAGAIADLIRRASEGSFLVNLSATGRQLFLDDHTSDAMAARLRSSEFQYDVAELPTGLVATIGVRNRTHLFSLYVAPSAQGIGLATMLWNYVKARTLLEQTTAFTVNSSLNAVPIYEHFGFLATSAPVDSNGVIYVPMRMEVA